MAGVRDARELPPGFAEDLAIVQALHRHPPLDVLCDPSSAKFRPNAVERVRQRAAEIRGQPDPEPWYERPAPAAPPPPPAGSTAAGGARANPGPDRPPPRPAPAPPPRVPGASAWGPAMWEELHRRPGGFRGDEAAERRWLDGFAGRLPCGPCQSSWLAIVRDLPPDLADAASYARWTWQVHSAVRAKLDQSPMTYDDAARRWGWDAMTP